MKKYAVMGTAATASGTIIFMDAYGVFSTKEEAIKKLDEILPKYGVSEYVEDSETDKYLIKDDAFETRFYFRIKELE